MIYDIDDSNNWSTVRNFLVTLGRLRLREGMLPVNILRTLGIRRKREKLQQHT